MSHPLSDIVEEETVTCGGCGKEFAVEDMTDDDWNFQWDGEVKHDCCNPCREELSMKMDRPFDNQDLENLELFQKGAENAVRNGGGDEGYRNIFYKKGYEFGMYLWSQYIDEERYTQGTLSNPPCREVK